MVLSMERWVGKVAVVTGASSGIGAGIVKKLVMDGLMVVGIARRKEKLDELSKKLEKQPGKLYPLKGDISKEEDIIQAFQWIKKNLGAVHVLINNAGISRGKGLLDGDTKDWRDLLDTNVLGLCIATREAARNMRENNIDGHIIHINSIAGHKIPNIPNISIYSATKYGVTSLTETLRIELISLGSKIRITSISPGFVKSEIIQASGISVTPEAQDFFQNRPMLDPEDIADAVVYALSTPPHVQVHEIIIQPVGEQA